MASVLVVYDESGLQKLIADMATREGHTVATAANGHDALRECLRVAYDIVITDLRMPKMGGDELVVQLRSLGYRAKICITSASFVSRNLPAEQLARIFGADAAITQPFDIEQFLEVLRQLTRSQGENESR